MATDYVKKINDLPIAASQAAPGSSLATGLFNKVSTVTTTGSGPVVTDITKSGATITVTKGDIELQKLTNPNFDNVLTPGVYNVQVTQACTGAPPGLGSLGSCILIVNAVEDDAIASQTAIMLNGRTCSRGRSGDGTWDTYWANRESRGYADATDAHAEGDSTQATGNNAHSEGYNTRATGASSHAEGNSAQATAGQAHAEGYNTLASAQSAHAEGTNGSASGRNAHKEGFNGSASGESSHTEGSLGVSAGTSSHTEGGVCYAYGKDSHAEGYDTKSGRFTIDSSTGTKSLDSANTSINSFNNSTQHAEGWSTWAGADASHAEGYQSYVYGNNTHLGGHAEGYQSYVSGGEAGHAEGKQSYVSGTVAGHAEGFQTYTGGGTGNHSEGFQTSSTGSQGSHSEGVGTYASAKAAHAEGYRDSTTNYGATGTAAHCEGYDTLAGGDYSHAEGEKTVANSQATHAEGIGTVASGTAGMHAAGKYNYTSSGLARVTGWGTGPETANRKDIERLDTDGNLWISGYLSGATVFMITPGTTTRAAIEAAYQANRPMMLDISGINGGNQVVYVPTEVRRVYSDNTGTDFDYYFKFTYPASYNAGYHAGTMEPNGLISSYYVAVTKDNGWVKMTDVSHNGWDLVSSSTSIDVIPYAKAVYAQSADTAQTASAASSAVANSTLDTSINNKLEKDGSNVTTTWSDSNINKILKNISAGTDDVWDGDDIIASSHSNNAKSQEFTRRTTAHLKKCMYNGGTLTGKFTSTVKVDNPICIEHSSSGKDAYFYSKVGSISCGFGVGSGGTNHGIWSDPLNAWMISEQGDQRVHINGNSILVSKTAQLAPGASSIDTIEICKALGSSGGPGYLACGAIRIAGTRGYGGSTNYCSVIKKSNHFTVSMSDMANPQEGQIYFYYNTSANILSVTWKFNNSTSTSGDVYVGCMAQFMLVDKDNQVFARIY